MNKIKKTTTELMNEKLASTNSFEEFETTYGKNYIATSLHDLIQKTMAEKGLSKSDVIKDANLERTYGYQILRGLRKPSRDKLVQLAFGLKLSAKETEKMFKAAGFNPLYAKIQNEAAIIYCLNKGYNYLDCTIFLDSLQSEELPDDQ